MSTAPPNGWKGVATEYTPWEITDPTLPTTFISAVALLDHQVSTLVNPDRAISSSIL
jgi:hypothetical protein